MGQTPQNPIAYLSGTTNGDHPEPLTPEQLSQITHARGRYKKVARVINVAAIDAWTSAIFAGASLLGSAFDHGIAGILFGLGMAIVSYNSFTGLKALRNLDPRAPVLLAKNQLLCGAIIFAYAAWNGYLIAAGKFDFGISADTKDALNQAGFSGLLDYVRYGYYALYGALAAFAVIGQSLTALYYNSRKKYVEEYLNRTAEWVLQMQKMGFKL